MNGKSFISEYWRSGAWIRRRCAVIGGLLGLLLGIFLVLAGMFGGGDGFEGAAYGAYAISRPIIWILLPIWKGGLMVPIIGLAPALNGLVLGWLIGLVLGLFPSLGKRGSASA